MSQRYHINIAGLSINLHDVEDVSAKLRAVYSEFHERGEAFKADGRNPHLCRAGCSHCCKSGAVFAVTLVEAVQLSLAIEAIPAADQRRFRDQAANLLEAQHRAFAKGEGPADEPGKREEVLLSSRISRLNAMAPACPLLVEDLCSVYEDRPLLCRAYGFPVDAYAASAGDTMVFRSLCVLYEGMKLNDYLRAKDLKRLLKTLSGRLSGGRDWGRFTSAEAILSSVAQT